MTDNKRIYKNSLFMAVRMLITMGITLFTSRVVLQQLGVTDFGIYSVVAGLSILVAFLNSSLTAAIQRYMNVELGKNDGQNMQRIFSACCVCIVVTALIVIVIAETAGLYFLNYYLSIPEGRMADANIVYQMSIVLVLSEVFRVPYNSLITSYEKMSFYAYNSILEAVLKLTIVILLSVFAGNKLIIYMWLLIGVSIAVTGSYIVYARMKFSHVRFSLKARLEDTSEIGRFAGWNVLTSVSDIAYQQGSAMILNIFFGVMYNATMGITNQVKTAVFSFTRSVQYASNPQIVKSYSAGEHAEFVKLLVQTSRLSYFLVLFLGIPLLLNMDYVLSLWLTDIPPQCALFARLMIVFCIIDSLTGPLWVAMQAYGKIASYQIVISALWILCLPLTAWAYNSGWPPSALLAIMIGIDITLLIIRIIYARVYCGIKILLYFREVVLRVLGVSLAGIILPLFVRLSITDNLLALAASTATSCVAILMLIYFIGCDAGEREKIRTFMRQYFHIS